MKIVTIHGVNATKTSFSFLEKSWSEHTVEHIEWAPNMPLDMLVHSIVEQVARDNDVVLVGHSLGGVAAALVARLVDVRGVVTICAPLAGSRAAALLRFWTKSQTLNDIRPTNPTLIALQINPPIVPWLPIVSSTEQAFPLGEKGDGVVSLESQTAIPGLKYQHLSYNHYEPLISEKTVEFITAFLSKI